MRRLYSQAISTSSPAFTSLSESNYSTRPIEELFPLIASLLSAGDYARGSKLAQFCRLRRPQDWSRALNSPAVANMIFKATLEHGTIGEFRAAFETLRRDLKLNDPTKNRNVTLKPDCMSFALMIKYVIMAGKAANTAPETLVSDLKYLIGEAESFGCTLDCILETMREAQFSPACEQVQSIFGIQSKTSELCEELSAPLLQIREINLPEVRTIASKSEGISFIKDSLKQLLHSQTATDPAALYQLQVRLEQDCYAAMIAKMRREAEDLAQIQGSGNLQNIRKELLEWHAALKTKLEAEFNGPALQNDSGKDCSYYVALLADLDPEKTSMIVIQELLKIALYESFFLSTSDGTSQPIRAARLVTLSTAIGTALQREVFASQISKKPFLSRAQLSPFSLAKMFSERGRALDQSIRKVYARLEGDLEAQREGWIPAWSNGLRAEIGSYLLGLVQASVMTTNAEGTNQPVFQHCIVYSGNSRKLGVIRIDDAVFERLQADRQLAFVEAWAMPMLVPPKPWLTITSGGYLTHKSRKSRILNCFLCF